MPTHKPPLQLAGGEYSVPLNPGGRRRPLAGWTQSWKARVPIISPANTRAARSIVKMRNGQRTNADECGQKTTLALFARRVPIGIPTVQRSDFPSQ